jgi:hypothetical protein
MFLVLASCMDAAAAELVSGTSDDVRLVTCADLSQPGWVFDPAAPGEGRCVVGEERVSVDAVQGVLTLLTDVRPTELPHIVEDDRAYIAAEMMAFLVAWLSYVPVPVVNRPTPLCLSGPFLRAEQWLAQAQSVGLPIRRSTRRVMAAAVPPAPLVPESSRCVVVVGRQVVCGADVPEEVADGVLAMASAVGAGLLTAVFDSDEDGAYLAAATPAVSVRDPAVSRAALTALTQDCLAQVRP